MITTTGLTRVAVTTLAGLVLGLSGCSGEEDSRNAASPDETTAADDQGSPTESAAVPEAEGAGTVTVDGITVTFTPEMCVLSPETPHEFIAGGPGQTDAGGPAYVDISGPNQLVVYLDEDPFAQTNDHYEFNPMITGGGPLDELDNLSVEGGTITAAPEMVRTDPDKTDFEPVGTASVQVTCD